jgi:hypothetical protein
MRPIPHRACHAPQMSLNVSVVETTGTSVWLFCSAVPQQEDLAEQQLLIFLSMLIYLALP